MQERALMKIDVISRDWETPGKLTNSETGDILVIVKASTLKSPLGKFMTFRKFNAQVIHR